jgi:GNAT superfamily N-acetyltransferase
LCFTNAGLWVLELGRIAGGAPTIGLPSSTTVAATVRRAEDKDALSISRAMAVPTAQVERRLALGKRCYVAEAAGQVVSYGWLSFRQEEIPELERVVHPGPDEAYIWDCFTLPAYRGKGLLRAVLRSMEADLRWFAFRRAWAAILADNRSSQHAFRKAGFTHVVDAVYLRVLGLRHLTVIAKQPVPPQLVSAAKRLLS